MKMTNQTDITETQPSTPTAIRQVLTYTACPVETCDRCGQGIKYVALVVLKDGSSQKYGLDCINKILAGDTSLKALFAKNAKLLKKYQRYLEILSQPVEQIAIDERGYYNRGLFFVADDEGKALMFKNYFFHPTKVDWQAFDAFSGSNKYTLNLSKIGGSAYAAFNAENWALDCNQTIKEGKAGLKAEIDRISGFLARILAKGLAAQAITL